jgi:hypothetical protein
MNTWERLSIGVTLVMLILVGYATLRQPTPREIARQMRAVQDSADARAARRIPRTSCSTVYRYAPAKSETLYVAHARQECPIT